MMQGQTRPHEGDSFAQPDTKRARYDGQSGSMQHMPPSPVVHVRSILEHTQPAQLAEAFQQYGPVNYILQMANGRQALVEFDNVDSAMRAVAQSVESMYIGAQQVFVNYSKSQSINRSRGGYDPARGMVGPTADPAKRRDGASGASGQPTHILFMTVANAQFPITTDVIHQICSPYGPILRIVIIRRQMPQCLVEFQNVDSAARAAQTLHGADIYSGCCTLSVEFSSTPTLNVRRNDDTTMDYTIDFQNGQQGGSGGYQQGGRGGYQKPALSATPPQHMQGGNQHYVGGNHGYRNGGYQQAAGGGYQGQTGGQSGIVVMIYNLDTSIDPSKLFNLLCIYGNVSKIKFLVRKPGTAMVEFQDPHFARLAKENLAKVMLMDKEVDVHFSKATYIGGQPGTDTLENGAEAFVAYEPNDPSHRFRRGPAQVYRPSNTIFFSNAPPGCNMEMLESEILNKCTHKPTANMFFPKEADKKASGLVEYATVEQATDVIMQCNNQCIKMEKGMFTVKLNFSQSKAGICLKQQEGVSGSATGDLDGAAIEEGVPVTAVAGADVTHVA